MMRLSLARRPSRPLTIESPEPLLAVGGARVVLGDHVDGNGLPLPLRPAPDTMFGPRGVCIAGRAPALFVADTGHHRLMIWKNLPDQDNTPADLVIGQTDFWREGRNARGAPGSATFNMPTGVASDGRVLVVADAWNHRVLIWRELPTINNQPADVVLGQADFSGALANRGADRLGPETLNWCYGATIADGRLFVADTGNRRVLVWNSLPRENGQPADLALGQSDMITRDDNAGIGAGAIGMRWPHSIVVDRGRIMVADAGNNRVMVWSHMPNADGAPCSFALGQEDLFSIDHNRGQYNPNAKALNMPYGLAVMGDRLICADTANSRLVGRRLAALGADAAADALAGQDGLSIKGDNRWRRATRDSLCWPFAIAAHGDLLAIADTGNNRVMLWGAAL